MTKLTKRVVDQAVANGKATSLWDDELRGPRMFFITLSPGQTPMAGPATTRPPTACLFVSTVPILAGQIAKLEAANSAKKSAMVSCNTRSW